MLKVIKNETKTVADDDFEFTYCVWYSDKCDEI